MSASVSPGTTVKIGVVVSDPDRSGQHAEAPTGQEREVDEEIVADIPCFMDTLEAADVPDLEGDWDPLPGLVAGNLP